MKKLAIIPGLLAAAFAGSTFAAPPRLTTQSGFYVVVPIPARAEPAAAGIEVSLSNSTMPSGLVGIPYDGFDFKPLLTVTGDADYTGYGVKWSVESGSLPDGLTLNSDGTVSGTPTADGASTFQVRATYKTKTGQSEYQILVGKIVVAIASGTPPQAIAGQFYSYDLHPLLTISGDSAYNGSGVTWTVVSSSLPNGLFLRTDGTIAGTPTAGGTGTITARATYRGSSGEQTFEVVTLAINVSLASAAPPQAIVGQAYSYDLKNLLSVTGDSAYDGSGVTWSVVATSLPVGLYLKNDGTIIGTPTTAGSGEVTARATYRGVNGQQVYQVVSLDINVLLATATPPQAIVGQAYGFDLKNLLTVTGDNGYSGSDVTWSVVANTLPAGLSLRTNGVIAGTPTAAASGAITARATYRGNNGQQTYQVTTLDISVLLAPDAPPQAIVGQAYNYDLKSKLSVTGDNAYTGAGVTWTVVSSTLPDGLTLRANGTIAGTPTAAGNGAVTARASYRGVNGEQAYQVVSLNINVVLAAGTPPQAIVGQAYTYSLKPHLTVTGDNAYSGTGVTWSTVSSSMPAGLTLGADGTISGTPTASGTGALVARATYRNVNGEQTYQVVALNITVALAAGSPPQAIVGQGYSYDLKPLLTISGDNSYSGSGVTWTVVSSTLATGLYLKNDGTIGGTPTASGTGTITARATYRGVDGQQTFQVVTLGITVALASATPPQAIVGQAYSYDLKPQLSVTGDNAYDGSGVTWTVVSSTLPAGLSLRNDGTIAGTPTASGTGTVTAQATYRGVNGQQSYQVVTLNITVALATATPPQAIVGQAYSYDLKPLLTVTGDSGYSGSGVTWSVVSSTLPAGLSLLSNGTIAGTPTASGTGNVTARATYRGNNGQQTYQIVSLAINVTLATATLPQAIQGQAYSYDLKPLLTVTGDSGYSGSGVTWSVVSSTLPAGMALQANGTIAGTPTASGTRSITVQASYRGNNGQQTYQVITLNITVALATATPPQAIVGQAYSYDLKPLLSVTGDSGYSGTGVTWAVVSSTLPAGLALLSDGTIGGTPTASGTGTVTARATYRGNNGQQTYQVVTLDITVSLATASPPQAIVGQAYTYDLKPLLTVSGDSGYSGSGVTWSVVSSTLPAGLTLQADGTIAGTPTASGTGTVTARATYRGKNGQQSYQVVTIAITVSLATATPPQAIVGQAYTYDLKPLLTVTGDSGYNGSGVTWAVVSSTLPAGLSLQANGTIAGTPTASGSGTVTVRATYRGNNGQQSYQVVTLAITVSLATATPPQAIVGQAYTYDLKPLLTVSGDSGYNGSGVTWTVVSSTLPAGLALLADGTISGTPTASGTGTVTARATYRGNNGQQSYQVVTLAITVSLATATPPQAIIGQAYSYDLKPLLTVSGDRGYTGSGVTWSVVSSTLPAGLTLQANGTIAGTPTASGSGTVTARATYRGNNGQQSYQVVSLSITVALATATPPQAIVGQAYSYDLKPLLTVSGDSGYNGSGVTWSTVSSTLPAGLQLAADGTISGTPTASGTGTVTARATYRGVNGQQAYQVVTLSITVALATATPPQALVGQAYNYDLKQLLSVTGDAAYNGSGVTWSVVSSTLPAGLTLRSDGTIGGTPTASGSGTVTARATYRGNNGQQSYQVVTLNITVALATATPPQAIVGQAYSYDIKPLLTVSGDASYTGAGVTWSLVAGSLPAGLTLSSSGVISGTPTAASSGTVTARATYRGVNGDQSYQLVSLNIVVSLATASPPQAIVGQAYSYDLKPFLSVTGDGAYNGSGVTWTVVSSTLPAGLSLLSNGIISGTPTASGTGTVTARATYRGNNGQQSYQVVSLNIVVALATATPTQARVGVAYSYDLKPYLSVTGDSGYTGSGVTWSVVSSALPAGLVLDSAGVISGTPTAATTGSVTARATYRGNYGQQAYSVTALPAFTYAWNNNAWTTPAACGSTTSTRSVWCQRSDGATVADANCGGAKPATTQAATDYSTCTYAWNTGSWATPAACGSTTSTRSVWCQRSDGTTVADASCGGGKPATTQAATDYSSCTYSWQASGWSTPAACGSVTQTRTVWCQRSDGTTVADASCGGGKPVTSQSTTDYSSCTYSFSYGAWSSPAACGSVTQTRTATCKRSDGTTVANSYCGTPVTSQAGTDYSACTYSFSYGAWTTPAGCGAVTQTRTATCKRSDGATVANSYCGTPVTSQAGSDYSSCTYSFSYGAWSTPAGCGAVTQTRSASCIRSDGATVANSYCGTPVTSQSGSDYSSCTYSFSYGGWGACSASCGGGTQTRSASCIRSDGATVSDGYCGTPTTSQSCNTQACAPVLGTFSSLGPTNCGGYKTTGQSYSLTIRNSGSGTITGISYTCNGGPFTATGGPSSLAPGAQGTYSCMQVTNGAYGCGVTMSGSNVTNSGSYFGY